ncbi:hypothetical protein HDU99_003638, partial [Rhizoclosmatium hyalinum]
MDDSLMSLVDEEIGPCARFKIQPLSTTTPVISHILSAMDSPFLVDDDPEPCSILDADLCGNYDDWKLVGNFLTTDERSRQILVCIDGKAFLSGFFSEPAPLRLVLCTIAAHYARPPLPDETVLSYYRRARKAVMRVADKPSLRTCQALFYIYYFTMWKGQPVLGRPFLRLGMEMILSLQLDVDPDDSPWLDALQLSDAEKEERRRIVYSYFYAYKTEQSIAGDTYGIPISVDKLNQLSEITEPYPAFTSFSFFGSVCEVYRLICDIKKHHSTAPESIETIMTSDTSVELQRQLNNVYTSIESKYLLAMENPCHVSSSDCDCFIAQLTAIPPMEIPYITAMNLNIWASKSLLTRPKLYLSSLKSCCPCCLSPDAVNTIITAINTSLEAAHAISSILAFLLDVTEGPEKDRIPSTLKKYFIPQTMLAYSLFEA